ncbi:ABC transporter substrate-binding protein [Pelagibacterium lacus]|nr:ABC transporter substrate-binding protein [Pelagibacterium lacus]
MRFTPLLSLGLLLATLPANAAEPVSVVPDWTPNTNFVGIYVAEVLGFYEQAGLEVEIVPLGSAADMGIYGVLDFYTLKAAGLDAVGVYAVIQTETGRLAYDADRASRPADLADGVYGGFGTRWEQAIIDTMIAHDGGVPAYETRTLDSSVYDALRAGEIDFTLEVLTWQGVENQLAGNDISGFAYADYGVPDQHTIILGASADFLDERPEVAAAFIAATQEGYAYAVANPAEAARILVETVPELAGEAELVEASMALMVEGNYLARSDGTVGVFDEAMMLELGDFLFEAGALVDAEGKALSQHPDFSTYFTNRFVQ